MDTNDRIKTFKAGKYNVSVRASNYISVHQIYDFEESGAINIFLQSKNQAEEKLIFIPGNNDDNEENVTVFFDVHNKETGESLKEFNVRLDSKSEDMKVTCVVNNLKDLLLLVFCELKSS